MSELTSGRDEVGRSGVGADGLALTTRLTSGMRVKLPEAHAIAAVKRFLEWYRITGTVIEGPSATLTPDQWALVMSDIGIDPGFGGRSSFVDGHRVVVFPRYTIVASMAAAKRLLRALEDVKPETLDADGRPPAWLPPPIASEGLRARDDDDDVHVGVGPILVSERSDEHAVISDATIREHWARLSEVQLTLARGNVDKHGLVTGRVWFTESFDVRHVHLTTCPSADLAEILATMVHELAHPMSKTRVHGDAFKKTLVALAEQRFGAKWFVGARGVLDQKTSIVDGWIATGIRASLKGGDVPVPQPDDDGTLARIAAKIKKLRQLAHDQLGRPEGIAATALANDLITTYGLGDYQVRIDAAVHDAMVDRWVVIRDEGVWRRELAHALAAATGVFSLSIAAKGRLHFFGAYADVVQAEYLFEVIEGRIERECERHLAAWKHGRALSAGATVKERTSFCDSAVHAFRKKLDAIAKEDTEIEDRLEAAEALARTEHEKRGASWHSGGARRTRANAAGAALGRSIELTHGVGAKTTTPRLTRK